MALGQKWTSPHGIEVKQGAVYMRGERFLTYDGGTIFAHEPRASKELRTFCAAKGVVVISAALAFDGASTVIEVETDIGQVLWSMPTTDKYQVRLQLTEVKRLASIIATELAHFRREPHTHPAWGAIVANDIRAIRAHIKERLP